MGDHVCPWWLAYSFDNPLRRLVHDPERVFAPYVTAGMTVLDAGCGMGFFSIGLARLVGDEGAVIATDVQQKMLDAVEARARRTGLSRRIRLRRCEPHDLGVEQPAGFILAFWMVHEVPDVRAFFRQARSCLALGAQDARRGAEGPCFFEPLRGNRAFGARRRAEALRCPSDPAQQIRPARDLAIVAPTRRGCGIGMIAANNSPGKSSRTEGPGERELPAIRARPTRRELAGIALTGISYALGWPAVGLLGALSVRMSEPLLAVIGMPSLLVLSHLTFAVGLYLAGGRRVAAFVSRMRRSRAQ